MKSNGVCDVMILCGGKGERLRSVVADRAKPMAEIHGRPFLDYLIAHVRKHKNIGKIILCVGHMSETVQNYYADAAELGDIFFSVEETPLGTAGAVRNAFSYASTDTVIILNGDSWCPVNYDDLLAAHHTRGDLTMVVAQKTEHTSGVGGVVLGEDDTIYRFDEKTEHAVCDVCNAGVYVLNKELLLQIPKSKKISLEYEVFPQFIRTRECYAYTTDVALCDLGTPEGYVRMETIL